MGTEQQEQRTEKPVLTEKPEITDEHKDRAREIAESYDEDRPTSTLPGSGGTVSGTAVTEWLDDSDKGTVEMSSVEGKVEYRKSEEFRKKQAE
jgi:hypothetical protein